MSSLRYVDGRALKEVSRRGVALHENDSQDVTTVFDSRAQVMIRGKLRCLHSREHSSGVVGRGTGRGQRSSGIGWGEAKHMTGLHLG